MTRTNEVRMFSKAEPSLSHLKCGVLGFAGAGKSFTSMHIAIGLMKQMKTKKPLFFLDSERGSQWFIELCQQAKIKYETHESRAFVDLMNAVDEAEKHAAMLIVDSISHFWVELVDAYKEQKRKKTGKKFLSINDWQQIKPEWARFTDRFLYSRVHIIIAGRAQIVLTEDEDEKLKATDVRMKAEKETGFEPHLLIDMTRETNPRTKKVTRVMTVLKDRNPAGGTTLDGKQFKFTAADGVKMLKTNKVFEVISPHVSRLNIGAGGDESAKADSSSEELFTNGDEAMSARRAEFKARETKIEELEALFGKHLNVRKADDKRFGIEVLESLFESASWTKIKAMKIGVLTEKHALAAEMFELFESLSEADQAARRLDVEGLFHEVIDRRVGEAKTLTDDSDLPF